MRRPGGSYQSGGLQAPKLKYRVGLLEAKTEIPDCYLRLEIPANLEFEGSGGIGYEYLPDVTWAPAR